jgi:hypothetical protein
MNHVLQENSFIWRFQGYFRLEHRSMISFSVFCSLLLLLDPIIEQHLHLCIRPVFQDQLDPKHCSLPSGMQWFLTLFASRRIGRHDPLLS